MKATDAANALGWLSNTCT